MDGFSILDGVWRKPLTSQREYHVGNAIGWLARTEKQAATQHALAGRLYVAKSGWLLLSVPNALVRGVYDAMTAPGAELPLAGTMNVPNVASDVLNAHISVMTAEEVKKIGAENINERGHMVGYSLGHLKEITPRNVAGVSKVWALQVSSPMLSAIRKSYGLQPFVNGHPFHITVAVRRKNVLQANSTRKAAADLTQLAPKWGERDHLLAALPQHLTDTQNAIQTQGNIDKEMTDLALIAQAWLKSQKQKELLAGRLKKFQETAAYPSLAAAKVAAELPWRERVEVLTRHPKTGKIYGGAWDSDKAFAAPGGGIDPGETPEQAAIRELLEETGIQAANPVRLPFDPVDNAWSDEYRQQTGRNFAGSRTHFVMADFVKKLRRKNLDAWSATNRGFYTPEAALKMMEGKQHMSPPVALGRRRALQHILDNAANKTAAAELSRSVKKDLLPGGAADNLPDREFSSDQLAEGAEHEREHTDNDQIAKEIAKDHLQEDPAYYKKVEAIEKDAATAVVPVPQPPKPPEMQEDVTAPPEMPPPPTADVEFGVVPPPSLPPSGQQLQSPQQTPEQEEQDKQAESKALLLAELQAAKEHSDNKRYELKTQILRRLMQQSPQDWRVDDPKPYHKGITHGPTKFKFHVEPTAIPASVKAAARQPRSAYMSALYNSYGLHRPITYNYNKTVMENIQDQAMMVKQRGDFMRNAKINHQRYMATLDPKYRYELAMKAMNNELEEEPMVDKIIGRYGDSFMNTIFGRPK